MLRGLFSRVCVIASLALFSPALSLAETIHQDVKETVSGTVLEIVSSEEREVTGTDTTTSVQEVRVLLEEGEKKGEVVPMTVEMIKLEVDDKVFVNRVVTINGDEYITFSTYERRPMLLGIFALFVAMLLCISKWQGVRALLSLAISVAAIIFVLVPALLAGYDPALTTLGIAAIILAFALFGTHGFNARSTISFIGTFSAVLITCVLSYVCVRGMRLTGFSDDASVYLNFATNGSLDLAGLLLGGIIIGILGILDDVAVTQASVVAQLKAANPLFNFKELYTRAIAVGRDHIGSIVNTLALAYVGVSLPLILLYAKAGSNMSAIFNQEVVAAELTRIIVGSIGLIMAVPATTAAAAWYYQKHEVDSQSDSLPHHHHHH
ncbi:MAG: YibE/F family protein [Patescibacteria group bacterium]